ncbi:translation initiation factor IF-3 [Ectothiorhodospira lacustris]|uniref:translation initiation factor IF-3 n=1 Tax=Ectothiorhodospira lacustris TaxID=2899127 RepID=UPI001EE8277C|nr:translation initiation factor IF-3 [Ectothiorhodospira lacustris]MCG5510282.1 translation initiation factor IF-3 [Ectothiorhodospira lacustris]MCG5521851.1 translation initiation factor IF-3 [Ectothiorhodospira lacustris]
MSAGKENRLNEQINVPQVRLIGEDGENMGVMLTREAMRIAEEAELDLVEIVPTADPPVCRVMDYGKFKFEHSKKTQAAKKNQKQVQIKEVKFRPGTDEGDYQVKLRNLNRFLENGDKCKVTIRFRGREMAHQELGARQLDRIEADLGELATVEQRPKMEGRQMIMVISPKKK